MIDKIKKEFKTSEKGITMVSLVVMIIILIILALITIGTITGRLGIIDISTEVAGTYGTEQNRSRLEALVEDTILKYDIVGEKLTTEKLAEEIEKEDWIKKAEVRKDEDGNPNDILVETEDGDNFQVEYDEETGEKHIHELGKSDGESFPRVEAEYERESTSIKAKAYDEDTGIEKIEIIYGGEIIGTQEGDIAEFKVSKSGTYTIKATANSGKVAYKAVRVSMKLIAPTIKITSQGKIQNGWYGGDGIPVEVTISTEDKTVTEVHYILRGVTQQDDTSVAGQEARITIEEAGRTIITGYTKDGEGNESEYVTQDVKYDNVKPRIDKVEAEGEKGNNDWFISDVIVSAEKAEDANSGVAGYYYFVPTEEDIKSNKIPSIEEMTYVSGQDRKITVKKNGKTTILLVIEDKAGNKSDIKTVAVKKDNEPPRDFQASYTNVGSRGFDISAATTDEHSGVVNYNFFVNINGEDIAKGSSEDGNGTIGDLEPKETYIVYVEAEDEAGNKKISTNMQVTTKGEVLPPTIELACSYEETNGWYRGDVDVTIRDSSTDDESDLASITYRVEGANEISQRTQQGREVTFKATKEGISNVIAFGTGTEGNITEEREKEIKIDKTAPKIPTIEITGATPVNNGWYKGGPVTVTINAGEDVKKDGVTDVSETKGVIYEITGATEKSKTVAENKTETIEITNQGITRITAQTVDNAGNVSESCEEVQVQIDGVAPEIPTITLNPLTPNGSNGWYKQGDITATISAEEKDAHSGAWQIEYTVGNTTGETEAGTIAQTVLVNTDGTTMIKAKTIDKAGNKSTAEASVTINRDVTAPSSATITITGSAPTTITVTADGADATSKVATYQFQYKLSSATTWNNDGTASATKTHTYQGLTTGQTYNVRVGVTDNAGLTTYSSPQDQKLYCADNAHNWEWKADPDSTCTKEGTNKGTCTVCGKTTTATIAKKAHTPGAQETVEAPTCTTSGTWQIKCTRCQTVTSRGTLTALGHTYTVFQENVPVTCTTDGYDVYKCARCNETTNINTVAHPGHDPVSSYCQGNVYITIASTGEVFTLRQLRFGTLHIENWNCPFCFRGTTTEYRLYTSSLPGPFYIRCDRCHYSSGPYQASANGYLPMCQNCYSSRNFDLNIFTAVCGKEVRTCSRCGISM